MRVINRSRRIAKGIPELSENPSPSARKATRVLRPRRNGHRGSGRAGPRGPSAAPRCQPHLRPARSRLIPLLAHHGRSQSGSARSRHGFRGRSSGSSGTMTLPSKCALTVIGVPLLHTLPVCREAARAAIGSLRRQNQKSTFTSHENKVSPIESSTYPLPTPHTLAPHPVYCCSKGA